MLSFIVFRLISAVMARTRVGDIRPTLMLDHQDIRFVFPGSNSWSGTYNGKPEHRRWLERLVRVGVKTAPDEVAVSGWPWNMTVCVRGHDYLHSPEGETVYENRFVIWGRMAWGRLKEYEVYEDTIKPRALDEYLTATEPALMAS